jgi:hypothetical protein
MIDSLAVAEVGDEFQLEITDKDWDEIEAMDGTICFEVHDASFRITGEMKAMLYRPMILIAIVEKVTIN